MVKTAFMEDCAHLMACRRLCKIARENGMQITRGCNQDCTAYQKLGRDLFNRDQVRKCMDGAFRDAQYGFTDPRDSLIEDFV